MCLHINKINIKNQYFCRSKIIFGYVVEFSLNNILKCTEYLFTKIYTYIKQTKIYINRKIKIYVSIGTYYINKINI